MNTSTPGRWTDDSIHDPELGLEALLTGKLGQNWVVGAPLGLGKPHRLLNHMYALAGDNPDIQLQIATALSLSAPGAGSGLQARFLKPFIQRHFGGEGDEDAFVPLDYVADITAGRVPDNIQISEFYLQSGSRLGNTYAQRNYLSSNYTHVARDIFFRGANVIVQLVAVDPERPDQVSLAGNPDVTLDLIDRLNSAGRPFVLLAEIHPDLPYMAGDAELPLDRFDAVLEPGQGRLYAVPRMPVPSVEHRIGLYASTLIRDGGTLQLGIGALGDAVCYYTQLRHCQPQTYRRHLDVADTDDRVPDTLRHEWGGSQAFELGLYGASEMFMDGFLHLHQAGILKRRVYDHPQLQQLINQQRLSQSLEPADRDLLYESGVIPRHLDRHILSELQSLGILTRNVQLKDRHIVVDGLHIPNDLADPDNLEQLALHGFGDELRGGAVLHAAFFLGSSWFYEQLRKMPDDERARFRMTRVSRINQLYGGEALDRAQRQEARFINTCMKMTLLGAAVSDQLADGQVVSGVGGQYNFVAMAHALPRGRSILMLRSTHGSGADTESNIVWEYPHATIPRHLRDIVITEYGVADLRGKTDEEVIQQLLCLADSRFQPDLLEAAKAAGKLASDWRVPEPFTGNTPDQLDTSMATPDFPLGTDFTATEQRLIAALTCLRTRGGSLGGRIALALGALTTGQPGSELAAELERMDLQQPSSLSERWQRRLLLHGLKHN